MSIQRELNNRTNKLAVILADANERITAKNGAAAPDLKNLPDAIGSIPKGSGTGEGGEIQLQAKTAMPTGKAFIVSPDIDYDGLSSVTVAGDANLVPENVAKDVTIYGVTGTHEGGSGGGGGGGSGGGGGTSGKDIVWQDITVTPEAYEVKVTAPDGFGIRSVTIPAEEDYVAENILIGADLWGLKGGHRAGTQLPAEYKDYLTEAILVCAIHYENFIYGTYVKGGNNFFLAENDEYITIGFVPATGLTITEYNPATTEFSSYGWVGYRRSKTGDDWAVEDHRLAENAGSCFAQKIKYATSYIEYNGMTLFPVGIYCYPDTVHIGYSNFDNGSFTETIETGDTLAYAVGFDAERRPNKITAPDGTVTWIDWGES